MNIILKEILSWENVLNNKKKIRYKLEYLGNIFKSSENYKNSFELLYFEELRSQFDKILESSLNKEKSYSGKIIDKNIKNKKFLVEIFIIKDLVQNFNNKSLVLITKKKIYKKEESHIQFFGIINKSTNKNGNFSIEVDFPNWTSLSRKNEIIQITILNQITGLLEMVKEFDALSNFKHIEFNLKNIILLPKHINSCKKLHIDFLDKVHLMQHFNKSQLRAIVSFLKTDMTLIQGPPGTGKTRTILGIISLLQLLRENFAGKNKLHQTKENILVCAPSNAAVDENITRAIEGFIFILKFDQKWPIKMVRLGPNYHLALDHISLENFAIVMSSEKDEQVRLGMFNKTLKKLRNKIIKKTQLIFTTLACTGYSIMKTRKKAEIVIIDEAGQAIELSTLIPIKKICKKLILIGDIQQLPATVFSKYSADYGYNRSLFKRFQFNKFKVRFLENQYRMHPQISSFPARKFYRNCLKNSRQMTKIKRFHNLRCFGPLVFFDICEGIEQSHLGKGSSWCNLDELRVVSILFRTYICLFPSINPNSIGLIGGYNGQIDELKNYKLIKNRENDLHINTIDGFQGREKDIIIFSCVRAKLEKGIGFLSDCRRVNVGFTRAKNGFWVVGNFRFLEENENWSEVTKDVKKRTRLITYRKPFERSARRSIYWSIQDNSDFSGDGNINTNLDQILLDYLIGL